MDYQAMVERAMRGVVRDALRQVAKDGLPGDHHLYITFRTQDPGVQIAERLIAQYPEEMTIVLQYQFWGLEVDEDAFEITLSFSGKNERLYIPLESVVGFADPSVNFGLQFKAAEAVDEDAAMNDSDPDAVDDEGPDDDDPGDGGPGGDAPTTGEVVALDSFRKKKT